MNSINDWNVIDRNTSGTSAAIIENVSKEDFPYAIFAPAHPFVMGRVAALVAYEDGEKVSRMLAAAPKMLTALKKIEAGVTGVSYKDAIDQLRMIAKEATEGLE